MADSVEDYSEQEVILPDNSHVEQPERHVEDSAGENVEKRWPGWPGESVFRMLVPSHKVGGIIGRKGEFIKKMCEETRACIKILEGPPGTQERAVLISAKDEPESSCPPAVDGLLRVHNRVVEGLEPDLSQATSNSGGTISSRLLVGATQAGSLIGKLGSTIKSIQEASNCIIRVLGQDDLPLFALEDDRIVEVQGEPSGVQTAMELIASHLRKFLVDRSVIGLFEMHMQNLHPQMDHNMPPHQSWGPQGFPHNAGGGPGFGPHNASGGPGFGPQNAGGGPGFGPQNASGIPGFGPQNASGIPGFGPQNAGGGPGFGPQNVGGGPGFGPNPQYMPTPRQHDNYYPPSDLPSMEKQQHQGLSMYGRDASMGVHSSTNAQPPQAVLTQVTQHMQIPLSYADAVIGNAGSNISYIRRNFMAEAASAQQKPANGPTDNSYGSHGSVYSSPPSNTGRTGENAGGYGPPYNTNYGNYGPSYGF
ncbi:hypothetical protein IFM89_020781 [Coptis chinensis]|uniref:K Homology domain-containing protein n=1 Tax=Coptis chinensis TaxID=261450 RepID=A0A835LUX8_9MAGN|nr:hypothetical protein IFM89_020781 [Coptis chinensis]